MRCFSNNFSLVCFLFSFVCYIQSKECESSNIIETVAHVTDQRSFENFWGRVTMATVYANQTRPSTHYKWRIEPGFPWQAVHIHFSVSYCDHTLKDDNSVEIAIIENNKRIIIDRLTGVTCTEENPYFPIWRFEADIISSVGSGFEVTLNVESDISRISPFYFYNPVYRKYRFRNTPHDKQIFSLGYTRFNAAMWSGTSDWDCSLYEHSNKSYPFFPWYSRGTCYSLHGLGNQSKTFDEAWTSCPNGSHLAITNDRPLLRNLKQQFQKHMSNESGLGSWIALRQTNHSDDCETEECWQWQLPNGKHWAADKHWIIWPINQPNNEFGGGKCGALFSHQMYTYINKQPCETKSSYICAKEIQRDCPFVFYEAFDHPATLTFGPRGHECYYVIKAAESNSSVQLTLQTKVISGNPLEILVYEGGKNQTAQNLLIAEWAEDWNNEYTVTSESDSIIIIDRKKLNSELTITFKQVNAVQCHCNETVIRLEPGKSHELDSAALASQPKRLFCSELDCEWTIETEKYYYIQFEFVKAKYISELVEKQGNVERRIPFTLVQSLLFHSTHSFTSSSSKTSLIFKTEPFWTDELEMKIIVKTTTKYIDCFCPGPMELEGEDGVLHFWHKGGECAVDCIYEIRAPREPQTTTTHYPWAIYQEAPPPQIPQKHGLSINYTYTQQFAGRFHYYSHQLSLIDGDLKSKTFPMVYNLPHTMDLIEKHQTYHTETGSFLLIYHKETYAKHDLQGFSLSYQWTKMCNCPDDGTLQTQSYDQILTSPDYPHPYCTNLFCRWKITDNNNASTIITLERISLHRNDMVKIEGEFMRKNGTYVYNYLVLSGEEPHMKSLIIKNPTVMFESYGNNVKNPGFKLTYRSTMSNIQPLSTTAATRAKFTSRIKTANNYSSFLIFAIIAGICIIIAGMASFFLIKMIRKRRSIRRYNDGKQFMGPISYNQLQNNNNSCLDDEENNL